MRKWIAKALAQRVIGLLPGSHRVNRFFQQRVTRTIRLDVGIFEDHLRRDHVHIEAYVSLAGRRSFDTVLEIGTGWHPILPIAFVLCGASRVTTVDIASNLTADQTRETIAAFQTAADDGRLARLLPALRADRLAAFRAAVAGPWATPPEVLGRLGIVPVVAREHYPSVAAGSVDFIVSNVALEYLPPDRLARLLAEFRRVLSPGGVMSHDICMMDQYCVFDPGISKLNFLRYSDRVWRLINNPLIPLSRLRNADYVNAFADAGFDVDVRQPTRLTDDEFAGVRLAERFKAYTPEDLRVIRALYVGRRRLIPSPGMAGRGLG